MLGGLDTLVFTGGIGENSAILRKRLCEELSFLDIRLDPIQNESNSPIISEKNSSCIVRVVHTDENLVMARHARGSSVLFARERVIMSSVIYEMIIFDWDGTAVPDRHSPIGDLKAALEQVLKEGALCAIVTGTNLDNILNQGIADLSPLAKHGLHICTNRGSEVFEFDSEGRPEPHLSKTSHPSGKTRIGRCRNRASRPAQSPRDKYGDYFQSTQSEKSRSHPRSRMGLT